MFGSTFNSSWNYSRPTRVKHKSRASPAKRAEKSTRRSKTVSRGWRTARPHASKKNRPRRRIGSRSTTRRSSPRTKKQRFIPLSARSIQPSRRGVVYAPSPKTARHAASSRNPWAMISELSAYDVGKTIGEGTFGKVKKGLHKLSGTTVAIKILQKDKIVDLADAERVEREIEILKRVRHPNVIRLYEVIDSPQYIFLITEYCNGGELFDYIVDRSPIPERDVCFIFHQIINGMDSCHQKNIIHRDLKPENMLIDRIDKSVKVIDFGLGNIAHGGRPLETACGSPCYAAPEMIAGDMYHGPTADMWSMGVVLFSLLCGYLPFEDPSTSKLYDKICFGLYEIPPTVSDGGRDLLQRILNTDPHSRYTVEDIRRHPWYTSVQCPTDPDHGLRHSSSYTFDPVVNRTIVRQMAQSGFPISEIIESVQKEKYDHLCATYYLLLQQHERNCIAEDSDSDMDDLVAGAVPRHTAPLSVSPHQPVADVDVDCILHGPTPSQKKQTVPKLDLELVQARAPALASLMQTSAPQYPAPPPPDAPLDPMPLPPPPPAQTNTKSKQRPARLQRRLVAGNGLSVTPVRQPVPPCSSKLKPSPPSTHATPTTAALVPKPPPSQPACPSSAKAPKNPRITRKRRYRRASKLKDGTPGLAVHMAGFRMQISSIVASSGGSSPRTCELLG